MEDSDIANKSKYIENLIRKDMEERGNNIKESFSMIDIYTYGDSPAAINLAHIINENEYTYKTTRKITRILNGFSNIITSTNHIDLETSTYLMDLVYHDFVKKCDGLENEKVRKHTLTVLSTRYKYWQRRKNTQRSKK